MGTLRQGWSHLWDEAHIHQQESIKKPDHESINTTTEDELPAFRDSISLIEETAKTRKIARARFFAKRNDAGQKKIPKRPQACGQEMRWALTVSSKTLLLTEGLNGCSGTHLPVRESKVLLTYLRGEESNRTMMITIYEKRYDPKERRTKAKEWT